MLRKILLLLIITVITTSSGVLFSGSKGFADDKEKNNSGMWGPTKGSWWDEWHSPHMRQWHQQRMQRHWRFMHGEVPKEYEGLKNPIEFTTVNIQDGGKLYKLNCAQCHGKQGMGDGEAAKNLRPSPALLAYLIQRPVAADSYLMWTISEGGIANKTDMPSFKKTLSKAQIWKIITYMHSGFPKVEGK